MYQAPNELRLQATLLILFGCSIFVGLVSLMLDAFPFWVFPERLMTTPAGTPALILAGYSILALTFKNTVWRRTGGILLTILACYGMARHAFFEIDYSERELTVLDGMPLLPSALVLLIALISLIGLDTRFGRRLSSVGGCILFIAGTWLLMLHLKDGLSGGSTRMIGGFSTLAAAFCLSFGISLLLLSLRKGNPAMTPLSPRTIAFGIVGVSATFALSYAATWGIHADRRESAERLLQHYQNVFHTEIGDNERLIERLAQRWAVFNFKPPIKLQDSETSRYFSDIPALSVLALMDGEQEVVWQDSRSRSDQSWFSEQMGSSSLAHLIPDQGSEAYGNHWFIPDQDRPFTAVFMVTLENTDFEYLAAVFNLEKSLELDTATLAREFTIDLSTDEQSELFQSERDTAEQPEIYESVIVRLSKGQSFAISAFAGPPSFLSFQGVFPITLLGFGLVMSYLIVTGRSVLNAFRRQATELETAEQEFRSLFSQSPDAVFAVDRRGFYLRLNSVARAIVGLDETDVGVTHFKDVLEVGKVDACDRRRFDSAFRTAIEGQADSFEISFTSPENQQRRNYACDLLPIVVSGEVTGVFIIAKDISDRLAAQQSERILTRSLESSDNGVLVVDLGAENFPVVFVNSAFCKMTGYGEEEIVGAPLNFLAGPETAESDIALLKNAVWAGESLSLTMKSYRRDGSPFWNQVSIAPVRDDKRTVTHYAAIVRDISEKREQENRLAFQATHDVLTGLGNRALLEDHLEHDLFLAKRKGHRLAVLFIDLDEFKPINDTLGHKVGDALLINVARRLELLCRESDTLVRFGGDEFVLLLPGLGADNEAEEVAERILNELSRPHSIQGHDLHISASIGISLLSGDLENPEVLLQQADMAMYKAKQQGRDTYEIFSPDLNNKLSKRVTLRNDLQEAIKSNQLFLHYQPQVDALGELCGIEALVRWKHPTNGWISPGDFIPIAEETGQIVQLGKWVTTRACNDARILLEKGILKGRMAVNLSPMQFHRPGFLDSVRRILEKTQLPAAWLELELTEGILMRDTAGAIEILSALSDMGVATAIDDFGTGFSSFSYLRDLPVKKIKIDQSFVSRIASHEKDAAVCKGIITMAKEMELRVVAEGVETEEQAKILVKSGCAAFQGYYFARPMPLEDLLEWTQRPQ